MFDQLFSGSRTADTGVGSVHGDGSSDLPISNCISGELGGVGMSIGYCTSSSPSVPTIITIVTPAKTISEDFLSDSLISVVPTRLEPEEEASSTQTSTRTFTASGFLAAIFGIGIALSFWTPKNLWVFMGGFGFRRERRRQKNRQQRAVEAAEEVAVEGNKLTNGQKDKGKARAIHNETEEGESSTSTSSERTSLLIGGPATYSSGLGLDNPRDSGVDLTNGEEPRATRPEKFPIHPEPTREPEPELTESDMLKTIDEDEEEEIELPINDTWVYADHRPSPIPSPRIESPAPHVEPEPPVTPPRVEPEAGGHGTSYPFNRNRYAPPLPTPVVVDTPVTNGYGPKQPGLNFSLDKSIFPAEAESPVLESIPKLNGVEKRVEVPMKVEEKIEIPVKVEIEVEAEERERVGEFKAGPSVSTEVEVPKVEEVVIPVIAEVETPKVKDAEVPKEVEIPKVEHIEAPKVKEVETLQVELVKTPKVESVEPLKAEKLVALKVEPKVEPIEAPKVEPRVEPAESPKVELVEHLKTEIPELKGVETPKVEVPKAETVVERPAEVAVPKAETVVERPTEVAVPKAETIVERPTEVAVPKAETVVERPAEVKKVEVAKSTPAALTVPSAPQIELIPPTPAFNSSFSEEAEEYSKERAEEGVGAIEVDQSTIALPDVEEEEEPVVSTKVVDRSMTLEHVKPVTGSLTVDYNDKEDDDISILNHPISHSPEQVSDQEEEEEPPVGLTAGETTRPGSSRAPSIIGDDNKSTKSGRRGFRRITSLGRDRSVDSMKKDKPLRRSLTSGLTGKKSKKDSLQSPSQVKLGEPTPPPTPPETSQDVARPESRRSERERRNMSWSNATSKLLSKEKRDQAKKNSDHEAAGGADATSAVDEVETAEPIKSSNTSISTNDRPTTADGKSKIPRGNSWFKKKSNSNLSADVSKAASIASHATAKQEVQSTAEAVDKGKGIDKIPVEEAPKPAESIKVIEAPPPPPTEEEQKLSDQTAEPAAAVIPASDRPKPPRLKSVMSAMTWRKKK